MPHLTSEIEVLGPWSLAAARRFWERFPPAALTPRGGGNEFSVVFRAEGDWSRAEATVARSGRTARIAVTGNGDLDAAAGQVARMLSLDVDAGGWPAVADRDPVIADAQARLPGLRPCGFLSAYEAAVWAVLSQRVRRDQAARMRQDLLVRHGEAGAFPAPAALRKMPLDLPGRRCEYLHAVADAACDGRLDGAALRRVSPDEAIRSVQEVKGLGPFAAELVVLRGAGAPDGLAGHERRLAAEVVERYGRGSVLSEVAEAWRPYRTWAAFHLRVLGGQGNR